MVIIGWLTTIIGVILSICGLNEQDSARSSYYGLGEYIDPGAVKDAENMFIIGIIIVVIGILILLAGYIKKGNINSGKNGYENLLHTKKCLKCGNIAKQNEIYCSNCGNDLNNQISTNEQRLQK